MSHVRLNVRCKILGSEARKALLHRRRNGRYGGVTGRKAITTAEREVVRCTQGQLLSPNCNGIALDTDTL